MGVDEHGSTGNFTLLTTGIVEVSMLRTAVVRSHADTRESRDLADVHLQRSTTRELLVNCIVRQVLMLH